MALSKKDKKQLLEKIEWEGFEYALIFYSSWPEIKDPEFQHLLANYRNARAELAGYIGVG